MLIVIDGPAGAGKTTLARALAEAYGGTVLDTGAIYRSLAWAARGQGVDWADEGALADLALALPLRFEPAHKDGPQRVFVGDEEVTTAIRTPDISDGASRVSAHTAVRAALLEQQRAIAAQAVASGGCCVAEGRDMGTVVFPNADYKFFLRADPHERARRRHAELVQRQGDAAPSLEAVSRDIEERDGRDSSRAAAPLRRADDAVDVDSSRLDAAGVLAAIRSHIDANSPEPAP